MIRAMKTYVGQYLRDLRALMREDIKGRGRLFVTYNRLVVKNILFTKIFKRKIKKENVLGYTIHFDNYNSFFAMFTEIFIHKVYQINSYEDIKNNRLRIIDCGSNIGMSIIYFKYMFPNSEIIGFEPDPQTFRILEENVKSNNLKNVSLRMQAVGDKKEKIDFYSLSDFTGGPGNSIFKGQIKPEKARKFKVEMVSLSSIKGRMDITKMDVEGAEGKIIDGLSKSGALRNVQNLLLEYHHIPGNKSNNLSNILRRLEDAGMDYIINSDTLVSDKITIKDYLEKDMYLLIINAFR